MKKVFKIIIAVLILALLAFCVFAVVEKPFKKVTFSSLSMMLCEAVGIETDDPEKEILGLGVVDESITVEEDKKLTYEEAYSIVARMYFPVADDESGLENITDSEKISSAFKSDISGLVSDGYVEKVKLKPKSLARQKTIEELILKIRGTDITEKGSCEDKITEGALSIKSKGVTLENTVFNGNIIVCDTDSASISLSNVTVKGKIIIRASKNTSVELKNGTDVMNGVYIVSGGGEATLKCDETVSPDVVSNGTASIFGKVATVTVLDNAEVKTDGSIGIVKTGGAGAITIENGSFDTVYAESPDVNIRIEQGVIGEKIIVDGSLAGSTITIAGNVKTVMCESVDSVINIKGTAVLETLDIIAGSKGTSVLIEKRAKIENLNNAENSEATVIDNRSQWDGRR